MKHAFLTTFVVDIIGLIFAVSWIADNDHVHDDNGNFVILTRDNFRAQLWFMRFMLVMAPYVLMRSFITCFGDRRKGVLNKCIGFPFLYINMFIACELGLCSAIAIVLGNRVKAHFLDLPKLKEALAFVARGKSNNDRAIRLLCITKNINDLNRKYGEEHTENDEPLLRWMEDIEKNGEWQQVTYAAVREHCRYISNRK